MNGPIIAKLVKSCRILRLVLNVYPAIRITATCICIGFCSEVIIGCSVLGRYKWAKLRPDRAEICFAKCQAVASPLHPTAFITHAQQGNAAVPQCRRVRVQMASNELSTSSSVGPLLVLLDSAGQHDVDVWRRDKIAHFYWKTGIRRSSLTVVIGGV